MTQFYIVEIQKFRNGDYSHDVHFAYDENPYTAQLKAEAKYHEVLAAAALSDTDEHSAIIISSKGSPVIYQCYEHEATD